MTGHVHSAITRSLGDQKAADCEGAEPAKETASEIIHPIAPAVPVAGRSPLLERKLGHNFSPAI
jgi:hypothetical protein